ncbi:UNVERIFIED_CONTAM: hypothetical protein GTU68_005447 [Idotea baltica]|nr:hypothetical protein [Idotea baltica]
MLKDVGAESVLIGHSERRHIYGEADDLINRKVHRALGAGLEVVLCIGELLEEREAGNTEAVVRSQLQGGLNGVTAEQMNNVVIAYEPVWAIGTGVVATVPQVAEIHSYQPVADQVRIQYGGSVKPDNVKGLMEVPDVDGALVGGASLKPELFQPIIDFAR